MTRLTIISFSASLDSAIMLNVEMWKCCQFQFQPPIFFFAIITLDSASQALAIKTNVGR